MRRPALPPLPFAGALADDSPSAGVRPIGNPSAPTRPRRLRALRCLTAFFVLLLFAQGLRLQVAAGSLLRRAAEENRIHHLVEYAARGIFEDRFGRPLVQNVPAIELVADPERLPDDSEGLLSLLREALPSRDLKDLRQRLAAIDRTASSPVSLLTGLSQEEFLAVSARIDRLAGLRTETTAVRSYRGNGPFSHVLGFTGKMSKEERPQYPTYLLTESVGKAGLERQYETRLRGMHGARRVEVDAYGSVQQNLGRTPPTPGDNLRLHLDAGLQEVAVQTLERHARAAGVRKGALVALDPFSGGVRALVSLPIFPHSDLSQGTPGNAVVSRILTDPAAPLLNRAVQGQYVPGSSFKLAVAAGALEEGIATPATLIESTGGIRVGQWFFPDWKPGGHGRSNLVKAIAESVNSYFYTIAGGNGEAPGLGIERLAAWASRLGFGAPTGVDVSSESSGFLPSPAWKEQAKQETWYIGDTYHAAIGQGDVLVTPMQLSVAASLIFNGGTLLEPRLLEAFLGPDGSVRERVVPVVRAEHVVREETAEAIRAGMREAVLSGSARGLAVLPVSAAAKTGTAQVGGTERTHAWVTVAAPVERPELILVVLVEEGGGGDKVAVPVAREILEWYFSSEQRESRAKSVVNL